MRWQEYQEAVGILYEQMSGLGKVKKNITISDKITGQPRQIDVWWEIQVGEHIIKILIEAKMRTSKLDIKDIEEIIALAKAVKADKAIIVTNNKWTQPAKIFADHEGLDLLIFTIEEATDLIVEGKWLMCYDCEKDCVVMDSDGAIEIEGVINWWLGGKCRNCKTLHVICQSCGAAGIAKVNNSWICGCNFEWTNKETSYSLKINADNN